MCVCVCVYNRYKVTFFISMVYICVYIESTNVVEKFKVII